MDKDFVIKGRKYQLNKINALKQFHIVRRMSPILGQMAQNLKDLSNVSEEASESQKLEVAGKLIAPIMAGMQQLSDKDSELILIGLLESVQMFQDPNWAWVARDGQIMFEDLGLPVLMQAAGRAFMFNLSGFFDVLPQVL